MNRIWSIFSPYLVYYLACVVAGNLFKEAMYEHPTEVSAVAALLAIPFLMLMAQKDKQREDKAGIVRNKKAPISKYGMIIILSAAATIALNNVLLYAQLDTYSEAYQEAATSLYSPAFAMQIVCVGIVFPIMEEYMFRGLIYRRIRPDMEARWAIVISALLFGMYHGNIVQAVYGMAAGIIFAYIYEKYGSMKAPILAHMVMNLTSCVLTAIGGFTWMLSNVLYMVLTTAVSTVAAIVMLRLVSDIEERPNVAEW